MDRYSLVGTTVKHTAHLPQDVGADEKHRTLSGETVYVVTTVGEQCVLGALLSVGTAEAGLTEAYRQFQREAQQLQTDYQPNTVNTDMYNSVVGEFKRNCASPFTHLNGFTYHDCWLQNMLVATSGQTRYRFRRKKVG